MDIEFRPDQQIPAGRYYVILRPVADVGPVNNVAVAEIPDVAPANVNGAMNGNFPNPAEPMNGNVEDMEEAYANGVMNGEAATMKNSTTSPATNSTNTSGTSPQSGGKKNKHTKKAKKAKGTRKLSGYMKFAQEVRPRILREEPSLRTDIPGIGRKIGQMWRNLSASEKARY
jgi:hypothetical protein